MRGLFTKAHEKLAAMGGLECRKIGKTCDQPVSEPCRRAVRDIPSLRSMLPHFKCLHGDPEIGELQLEIGDLEQERAGLQQKVAALQKEHGSQSKPVPQVEHTKFCAQHFSYNFRSLLTF